MKRVLLVLLAAGFASAGAVLYCLHLSGEIEHRFSGRRWRMPSTVYSDITVLFPGQSVNFELFFNKLDHLEYRRVSKPPSKPGEYHRSASVLTIFLHDLDMYSRKRKGFPARLTFSGNQINSIENLDEKKSVPVLELEPEEILVYFGPERERRRLVALAQVPRQVIHAVLAAEDSRFYDHRGLDPRGILRAVLTNLRHGSILQGGSTITQQLAKNYFLTPEKTLSRKIKELFLAISMEITYPKDDILEIYLNEIYFGQKGSVSVNGIGEASVYYFGKPVEKLSLHEAAAIAGLIKAPNIYSPYQDKKRSRERRDVVLKRMHELGWITGAQLESSLILPVAPVGYQQYEKQAPYFTDYLFSQLSELYSPEVLSSLGFSIYTTLDTQVQAAAENALEKGLSRLEKQNPGLRREQAQKKLQGAIIVAQPKTGYILAMVGGRNYGDSQFNRITQAKRQPGSAFKPFVFLSGLDKFNPSSVLSNEPKIYDVGGTTWQPRNFALVPENRIRVRDALANSVNLAAVDLAVKTGLDTVLKTVSGFGFSTPLKPYPSLALGAFEVAPLELAQAYCAFAADGLLPYPMSLKEVVDEARNVLERRHMDIKRVTSVEKAFLMSSLLQSTVVYGTARSLSGYGITWPVAGKTGTTDDFKDAWFVGYTPDILALVWVGFDDGSSVEATGATAAVPIWADLVKSIPHHVSGEWFEPPEGVVQREICVETGELAVSGSCPRTLTDFFLLENAPRSFCQRHAPEATDSFKRIIKDVKKFFENF
jgi:penicillin-binding protein 1B